MSRVGTAKRPPEIPLSDFEFFSKVYSIVKSLRTLDHSLLEYLTLWFLFSLKLLMTAILQLILFHMFSSIEYIGALLWHNYDVLLLQTCEVSYL